MLNCLSLIFDESVNSYYLYIELTQLNYEISSIKTPKCLNLDRYSPFTSP